MKTQPHPSDREVLEGLVERVTYQNAENGFCAATIAAGEWITALGDWVNDRTHGQQFRARFPETSEPTSVEASRSTLPQVIGSLGASSVLKDESNESIRD
jgi:exodeoxyribonuclease V alpha subunit